MANEDRLKVKITKSGYQAAIDNSRDANGFKIKISKADVYDDKNNLRGTFDVVGKNIGQQQIALRIAVVDKTTSYGIKTIKLIDKYSGVEFAIISHPAGEMIDYINPHKIAYITCNLIITSLDDHTVTIIDSSTADADMGMIDGQFAEIRELIGKLPGVNLPGNQDTSGNAATASKLFEGRNIGGVYFDGTADIDLPGVNKPGNQNTSGNAATASYAAQIAARKIGGVIFNAKTDIDLPGVNKPGNQNTSGNAATASKLFTARKIAGVEFDGSADIDLPGVNKESNQNTSGNAATASRLFTPRQIGGVSFDGSQDIDLPGVNIAGNQNTSGNAGSATVLQTSRQFILRGDVLGSCWFNGDGNAVIYTEQYNSLGFHQGLTTVTASRAYGTVYVNQTSAPIFISICFYHTNNREAELWIDDTLVGAVTTSNEDSQRKSIYGIVPVGQHYILKGNLDIRSWAEMR